MISAIMLDFQQDQKCGDVFFGGIEQHETAIYTPRHPNSKMC
jgi:hypothetical protein